MSDMRILNRLIAGIAIYLGVVGCTSGTVEDDSAIAMNSVVKQGMSGHVAGHGYSGHWVNHCPCCLRRVLEDVVDLPESELSDWILATRATLAENSRGLAFGGVDDGARISADALRTLVAVLGFFNEWSLVGDGLVNPSDGITFATNFPFVLIDGYPLLFIASEVHPKVQANGLWDWRRPEFYSSWLTTTRVRASAQTALRLVRPEVSEVRIIDALQAVYDICSGKWGHNAAEISMDKYRIVCDSFLRKHQEHKLGANNRDLLPSNPIEYIRSGN